MANLNKENSEGGLGSSIEKSLIELNVKSLRKGSENKIQLIVPNCVCNYVYSVPFIKDMDKQDLADRIGAERLDDYNMHLNHVKKARDFSTDPNNPKLVNENEYLVITKDIENTKRLIENYKHGN